ncbi:MAG: PAS domain S-box protein [Methanomicrobiales archaeon]
MEARFRVLYVDDEPGLLGVVKLYLEKEEAFEVDTLASARMALEKLDTEEYDAIISDYHMPEIDGITFLKQLKASGNVTPFIIFTGRGREEVVIQALNEGADFYLQKGGEPKSQFTELSHKIRSAISRKRTENALRESELFLKGTQHIARLGGWKANFHTDYLEWTDGIYDIVEAPRDYRPGLMEGMKYYAPEDIPVIREKVATCLLTGEPFTIEARIITDTGKELWTEVRGLAPVTEGGRSYVMGTLQDITERKKAEEAMQRQSVTLSILNGIISTVNKADDLAQLLDSILAESLRLMDFDAGGIYLVDHTKKIAGIVHSLHLPPEFLAEIETVPIDKSPYDTLFIRNEPIFTENYAKINPERSEKYGFQSAAIVPLLAKGAAIGALNITSTRRYAISDEEKQTLISIGSELGSTIERMIAEEYAKKSSKNLETLFNSIDEMVFVLDMQGTIVAANTAVSKRLLYTSEELRGTNVLLLHVPERRDEAFRIVQGMIAGKTDSCPVPVLAKDGTRIRVETKVTRGWWNNKEVLIGVSRDVTERMLAEEALAESEKKYRLIVENSHDIIYTLTKEGEFIYVSPTWTTLLGHPVTEVTGQKFQKFVHPDDLPGCMTFLRTVIETGQRQEGVEYRVQHSDGQWYWHTSSAVPFDNEAGNIAGFYGIARDITERKLAEEALSQANKKLNLLSCITRHDINNQLTVLQGYMGILEKRQCDPSLNEYFEKMSSSAERISSMIRFTREYEEIGMHAPVYQDCRTIVDAAAKEVHLAGVLVKNDIPPGAEVLADPLVVKVVYNLMDNAVRYGGKITTIRFHVKDSGDDHIIVCEDDGNGVPAEEKAKIFERGFGKTTGMGLALSREILDITGITIIENGEPGKGARFEIIVPKDAYRDAG